MPTIADSMRYTEFAIPTMAACHGQDIAKALYLMITDMLEDPASDTQREEMKESFGGSCVHQALDALSIQGEAE